MLLHGRGESILRVKGLLSIEGEAAPVAVHSVQKLVHAPVHLTRWPSGDRRTRIVFIGKNLDESAVRRSFAAFVMKEKAPARGRSGPADQHLGQEALALALSESAKSRASG